jgi:hypothetical protein
MAREEDATAARIMDMIEKMWILVKKLEKLNGGCGCIEP